MKKTIIKPLDRPFARAVAVELANCTRVYLSGAASGDGSTDLEEQTRDILEQLEDHLATVGGGLDDIVRVRVYLNTELNETSYEAVNTVREEVFSDVFHYPASTLIEVAELVSDEFLIEIDAEAIVPDDEWEVEIIE